MKKYEPTKREIEVDALKIAIKKTEAAQLRAQETLYRLAAKKERQQAELLLQSMFAKFERKALVIQETLARHPNDKLCREAGQKDAR